MGDGGNSKVVVLEPGETRVPTQIEVEEYAAFLGIDVATEPHLLWIAWEGVAAPVPPPWKTCHNLDSEDEDEIFYFNFETAESVWDHPCDDGYRQLVVRARREYQRTGICDKERLETLEPESESDSADSPQSLSKACCGVETALSDTSRTSEVQEALASDMRFHEQLDEASSSSSGSPSGDHKSGSSGSSALRLDNKGSEYERAPHYALYNFAPPSRTGLHLMSIDEISEGDVEDNDEDSNSSFPVSSALPEDDSVSVAPGFENTSVSLVAAEFEGIQDESRNGLCDGADAAAGSPQREEDDVAAVGEAGRQNGQLTRTSGGFLHKKPGDSSREHNPSQRSFQPALERGLAGVGLAATERGFGGNAPRPGVAGSSTPGSASASRTESSNSYCSRAAPGQTLKDGGFERDNVNERSSHSKSSSAAPSDSSIPSEVSEELHFDDIFSSERSRSGSRKIGDTLELSASASVERAIYDAGAMASNEKVMWDRQSTRENAAETRSPTSTSAAKAMYDPGSVASIDKATLDRQGERKMGDPLEFSMSARAKKAVHTSASTRSAEKAVWDRQAARKFSDTIELSAPAGAKTAINDLDRMGRSEKSVWDGQTTRKTGDALKFPANASAMKSIYDPSPLGVAGKASAVLATPRKRGASTKIGSHGVAPDIERLRKVKTQLTSLQRQMSLVRLTLQGSKK